MSKPTQTALLTCLLALLPAMGHAQTCQTDSIPATTPTAQFTDPGDGTVTDTKTGLMWKKCSEGQTGTACGGTASTYTWQAALGQAQTTNTGGGFVGYTDWRVPNIKELRSITEKQCYEPAINLTVFPAVDPYAVFWSSSPVAASGGYAWSVYFNSGDGNWYGKYDAFQVRLVRSGQ